jgi:hypothetical protein
MVERPGAYADDVEDWRAIAIVALGVVCLGAMSCPFFEARMAAASHTLLTPTCFSTIVDGDGISVTVASWSRVKNVNGRLRAAASSSSPSSSAFRSMLASPAILVYSQLVMVQHPVQQAP